jgi:hypothetical protein
VERAANDADPCRSRPGGHIVEALNRNMWVESGLAKMWRVTSDGYVVPFRTSVPDGPPNAREASASRTVRP